MRLLGVIESNVIDLTEDNEETKKMKAKVRAYNIFSLFAPL